MKKSYLLMLLPFLLVGCNKKVETSIYEFNGKINQETPSTHEFQKANFKDYQGDLTPTDASLLTFDLSEDGTYYIVSDNDRHLNTPNLVIPSEYNNLPVKEIASEAFAYKNWLISVAIPSSITKIGAGAFNSSALKTVYYDAVEIEELNAKNWVFYKADADQSIDIYFGKHVKSVPSRLFFPLATDPSVTCVVNNVYFATDSVVESIGDYAFYKLSNLTSTSLPSTVKSIGKYAFYESAITEIDLQNVENVGDYAFAFSKLSHVKTSANLKTIGEGAFAYNYSLSDIDLRNTQVTVINDFTFKKCTNLEVALLSDNVTSIKEEAFSSCQALRQFYAPAMLKSIGLKAFMDNINLKSIYLNKELVTLGDYAFSNATNLEKLYIDSSKISDLQYGNNVFANVAKNSKLQVAFLEGVTTIPSNLMFSNASEEQNIKISELVLPKSLKTVKTGAFYDLEIETIWYLGKEENFEQVDVQAQNDTLDNVSYAIIMK